MFTDYIAKAVERTAYEKMESGRYCTTIPGFRGLWAAGRSVELARRELIEALKDWVLLAIRCGDEGPVIARLNLNKLGRARHAEARQPA